MIESLLQFAGYDRISFWIVVVAVFVNVACALLGSFLVLRRMSLLGDAISHAILPGLALGFILTNSRALVPMLLGALVIGVLTALLTQLLHRFARVPEDAAMGVVFTSLFAVGVILIHHAARHVDLDPGCVLYGMLESVALDTSDVFGAEIPRTALSTGGMLLATLFFVLLFWKELKIASFDPQLATAQGINANLVHYLLMAMVAAVTVTAFEAVGSILVVAMLIVPGAAALLLTDRLGWMLAIAAGIGIATAIVGRDFASHYKTSVAGMMAVVAGGFFVLAVILAPRHGVLMKQINQLRLSLRIVREDVLALLYRAQEVAPQRALSSEQVFTALHGGLLARIALWTLQREGRIQLSGDGYLLTEKGGTQARGLVKTHRLWEAYLQNVLGLPPDHVHTGADRTEHYISPQLEAQVSAAIDNPRTDPHGKPIPRSDASRSDIKKI